MKNVMICEGFNDGMFFKSLMKELCFKEKEVKLFDQKDLKMHEKRNAETIVLRSFMQDNPYNPYKFLIKLEGGKKTAIKIFCRELVKLISLVNCILMVDLDKETAEKRIQSLKTVIKMQYSNTPLKLNFEKKAEHHHLYHFSCTIFRKDAEIGKFQIVLFRKSLECSCSIGKKEPKIIKEKKIEEFIRKEKVKEFFQPIINQPDLLN